MKDIGSEKQSQPSQRWSGLLEFLSCNRSYDKLTPAEIKEEQGRRYLEIQRKLIRLFVWRGSDIPEELADRTFDRVADRLPHLTNYVGDPSFFVCAVGRLIYLESLRKKQAVLEPSVEKSEEEEHAMECLEKCLRRILPPGEQELILEYYRGEKRTKIEHRELLARQTGSNTNALRIQTCRIRRRLRKCITDCLMGK